MNTLLAIIVSIICSVSAAGPVVSDTVAAKAGSGPADSSAYHNPITVSIELSSRIMASGIDTLELFIESHGIPIAGASLKVGLLSDEMEIIAVVPGELIDSCDWEFFTASPAALTVVGFPPKRLSQWKLTTLAKSSADTVRANCLSDAGKRSLAKIVCASAVGSTIADSVVPVFFYWDDCRDNSLSDASGAILYISDSVLDFVPTDSLSMRGMFPTRFGTPASCFDRKRENHPKRQVQFQNGGFVLTGVPSSN